MVFWHLVKKEIIVLLRDKQALGMLFLMPMVFIFFLSLALKQVYDDKMVAKLEVVIENIDKEAFGKRVEEKLSKMKGFIPTKRVEGLSNAEMFQHRHARAVINIPETFSKDFFKLVDGKITLDQLRPITWEADPILDGSYKTAIVSSITIAIQTIVMESMRRASGGAASQKEKTEEFAYGKVLKQINSKASGEIIPNPLQQNVPGWSLFAMFFIVMPLSNCLIRERQNGTLRRLLTYRATKFMIISSKMVPYWFVNIIQFALMLGVGLYVIPLFGEMQLQLGSQAWQLIPVTMVCALASTAFGMMVSCLMKTTEQASAFGTISVVILSVIGGIMVPHFVMPVFMQKLAYISPLYWGLQSYLDVLLREAAFTVIMPKLVILAGFAVLCLAVAQARFRWN